MRREKVTDMMNIALHIQCVGLLVNFISHASWHKIKNGKK